MNTRNLPGREYRSTENEGDFLQAIRKPGARRFSFTEAILGESNCETAMATPRTSLLDNRSSFHYSSLQAWNNNNDESNLFPSSATMPRQEKKSPQFEYSRTEKPKSKIGSKINQFEFQEKQAASAEGEAGKKRQAYGEGQKAKFRKGSLEDEMQRPEVLALVKKYHPGMVDAQLFSQQSRNADHEEVEVESQRKHYREKVASHYRRIVEEQKVSPDAEFLSQSWSSDVSFREADSPVYKPGIDDSDWQAIDHRRSLSLEKDRSFDKSRECKSVCDESRSTSRQGGDSREDKPLEGCLSKGGKSQNKKPKRVRVRRHDSLIKYDSEPNLTSQRDSLDYDIDEMVDENRYYDDQGQDDVDYYVSDTEQYSLDDPDMFSSFDDHFTTVEDSRDRVYKSKEDFYQTLPRDKQRSAQSTARGGQMEERIRPVSAPDFESIRRSFSPPASEGGRRSHNTALEDYYITVGRGVGHIPSESSERSSRIDPHTYQSYAAGILNSSRKSERFLKLQKQYSTLERIAQIEEDTLNMNSMLGRSRFNNLDVRSKSLGSLAPQSRADAMLLSKYKLDNLWELRELYADLDEAQEDEEFFFDNKRLEEIQWNPWQDRGLNCKNLTIQDLQLLYEAGRNLNTKSKRGRPRKESTDFRRELSFKKLCEKYQHLDEESKKESIMEEVINMRLRGGRRDSETSSIFSQSGNLTGSYLQKQENAARKSTERPLYGYHINEQQNRYEDYVQKLKTLSKSCPDIRDEVSDRSKLQTKPPLQPSQRIRQAAREAETGERSASSERRSPPRKFGSSKSLKDEKSPPWRQQTTERTSPSTKSSESGYDSHDSKNELHPRGRDSRVLRRDIRNQATEGMSTHPRPSRSGGSPERSTSTASALRQRSRRDPETPAPRGQAPPKPARGRTEGHTWKHEVRGVVGADKLGSENERGHKHANNRAVREINPENAAPARGYRRARDTTEDQSSTFRSPPDVAINKQPSFSPPGQDLGFSSKPTFSHRNRFRKDSKPNPGAVSSALSLFRSLEEDYWKGQLRAKPGRRTNENRYKLSASLENIKDADKLEEEDVFEALPEVTRKRPVSWETGSAPVENTSKTYSRASAEARKGAFRKYGREREMEKKADSTTEGTDTRSLLETSSGKGGIRRSDATSNNSQSKMRIEQFEAKIRSRSESPPRRGSKDNNSDLSNQRKYQTLSSSRSQPAITRQTSTRRPSTDAALSPSQTSQYDYISVSTSKTDRKNSNENKTRFTVKYNPATGRISPVQDPETGQASKPQVSRGPTFVKSNQAEVRHLTEPHPSDDTRYQRKWGVRIPPAPGESSGAINLNYYQKTPERNGVQGTRAASEEGRPLHQDRRETSRTHYGDHSSPMQRPSAGQHLRDSDDSDETLEKKPISPQHSKSRYLQREPKASTTERTSPTARVPPMRPGDINSTSIDKRGDDGLGRTRQETNTRSQPASTITSIRTEITNTSSSYQSPPQDETDNVEPHQRSFSTSQVDQDELMTDPHYGDLGRWSGVNMNEGLDRRRDNQDAGKLQKWGATNLTRADSKEYGSNDTMIVYSSNDTLIIKGSDPDLSSSFESSKKFSSVKQMKNVCENRKLERSYSDTNLAESDIPQASPRAVKSIANLPDEEKTTSTYFSRRKGQFEERENEPTDFGSLHRTVSGDFKDILQKYESGDQFRNRAWERYEPQTPTSPMGNAWRRQTDVSPGELSKMSPILAHWQRLMGHSSTPADASKPGSSLWSLVKSEVSDIDTYKDKYLADKSRSSRAASVLTSPVGYRSWDVVKGDTPEFGPKEMIADIDLIGSEWQRDSLKRGTVGPSSVGRGPVPFREEHRSQQQGSHSQQLEGYPVKHSSGQGPAANTHNRTHYDAGINNRASTQHTEYRPSNVSQGQAPPHLASRSHSHLPMATGDANSKPTAHIPDKQRPVSYPQSFSNSINNNQTLPYQQHQGASNAYYHPVSRKGASSISQQNNNNQNPHQQSPLSTQYQGERSISHADTYNTMPRRLHQGAASVPPPRSRSTPQLLLPASNSMSNEAPDPRHSRSKSTQDYEFSTSTLPTRRASNRDRTRSLSAVEQLGITSPPPTFNGHKGDRAYSESPTPLRSISISSTRSPSATLDRRRRDEETARRKEELKRITAEERRKRWDEEMKANEARRHTDHFMDDEYWMKLAGVDDSEKESSKSPIQLDRFEEAASLPRPKKKAGTKIRGKAKARYNFTAQNPRELSFRKHDVIYLLRQLDRNWYEGEKHGRVGIFPCNYVEVLTSLDEARQAAFTREGLARAKYSFRPQTAMELKLTKGDTVYLIRKVDSNWMEGRVGHEQGIFPASYVDIVSEPDTPLMTPLSSYAPTPATGSPGQLSPVSTISNGPAPTIPSAPISPRGFDGFDFDQPLSSYGSLPAHQLHPSSYHSDYTSGSQSARSPSSPYGSLDRQRSRSALNGHSSSSPSKDLFKEQRDMLFMDLLHDPPRDPRTEPKGRISPSPYYGGKELVRAPSPSGPIGRSSPGYGTSSKNVMSKSFEEPRYPLYRAVFTYMPQNEDELELREGDRVRVMEKCDDGWFVGTSERTKEFGTFPGNYVQPL